MDRRVFLLFLGSVSLFGNREFQEYKNEFTQYKKDLNKEFLDFKKAYYEEFVAYKKEIGKNWKSAKTTGVKEYVYYSKDFQTRAVVDFQNGELILESQKKTPQLAAKSIKKELETLLNLETKEAYERDFIAKVDKRLGVKASLKSGEKIIGDLFKGKTGVSLLKNAEKEIVKDKNPTVKVVLKLPKNALRIKAKEIVPIAKKYAKKEKIDLSLIMAIIHSESYFNPMAKSHIPAFGLMQIVPRSAGRDSIKYLTGKDRLLSANYLYNGENNIKIGVAYLHLLQYHYLKNIKNPTSRLYCVIAAYNTGAGNVARAFSRTRNTNRAIKKINSMDSYSVYNHLLKNLPYNETKSYLKKVLQRQKLYG